MKVGRAEAAAVFLTACVVLGGASAAGVLANALLQLVAVGILLLLLVRRTSAREKDSARALGERASARALWWLVLAYAALWAIELLPLPPGLWSSLPGRGSVAEAFAMLGLPPPWLTLSLAPEETIGSLLSWLPPLAILLLLGPASASQRQLWPVLVVALALVQIVLGLAQVSGGRGSPFYFYDFTNWGSTVGFFANANHHATLLLMALPFAAALATQLLARPGQRHDVMAKVVIAGCIFAVIAGGLLVNGSRAGLVLLPIVLLLCAYMIGANLTRRSPKLWLGLAAGTIAVGVVAAAASGPVTREALADSGRGAQSSRAAIWERSWPLAAEHFPTGSGLGSFQRIYRMAEDPIDRPRVYANHAHNDYLELLLELGMFGILLLAAFLWWYARRSWIAWTSPHSSFARAASIAIAAVLVHSVVDYPIRTAAISALFALCCAMLLSPVTKAPTADETRRKRKARRPAR